MPQVAWTLLGRKAAGSKASKICPHGPLVSQRVVLINFTPSHATLELTCPLVPNHGWKTAGLCQGILSEKEAKNPYFRKTERKKKSLYIWKKKTQQHALDTRMCKHIWGTTPSNTMASPWKNIYVLLPGRSLCIIKTQPRKWCVLSKVKTECSKKSIGETFFPKFFCVFVAGEGGLCGIAYTLTIGLCEGGDVGARFWKVD